MPKFHSLLFSLHTLLTPYSSLATHYDSSIPHSSLLTESSFLFYKSFNHPLFPIFASHTSFLIPKFSSLLLSPHALITPYSTLATHYDSSIPHPSLLSAHSCFMRHSIILSSHSSTLILHSLCLFLLASLLSCTNYILLLTCHSL
jgi:hypothetical protein